MENPREERKRRRKLRLIRVSVINAAVVLAIWATERLTPGHWFGVLLTYAPQFVFGLATLVLLIVSAIRRNGSAIAINGATILFVATVMMGFQFRMKPPEPGTGMPLRVMTFNVEKWSHGAERVAEVVRGINPDVVCFEEAGDYFYVPGHQPSVLQSKLTGYHFIVRGEIIVASKRPIHESHFVPLPPGPESRPAVEVVIDLDGKALTVVAVHLLPGGLADNGFHNTSKLIDYCGRFAAARRRQDDELLGVARQVKTPLVIFGDFNAQPQTEACRRLTVRYPDAFDTVGRGFGYTIPTAIPAMRIDHILIGNGIAAHRAWVPNVDASDHRPLVTDLFIRPEETR